MSDKNQPAFPTTTKNGCNSGEPGMTLRAYFAAHATDEDAKAQAEVLREISPMRILQEGWRSTARYMHADWMLAAREAK
jgi:hypothetical protein